MTRRGLVAFITESNAIESIHRPPTQREITAHEVILARPSIEVIDLEAFVHAVADAHLRRRLGANVYITGSDARIPPGGPDIETDLVSLLGAGYSAFDTHVAYELLHPFEDGNGRSGRVLWAWMMLRGGNDPFYRPFLQEFYYQTLEAARD